MTCIGAAEGATHPLVMTSPEVMGGAAVFAGTRVPIDVVMGSIEAGIDRGRLLASYPFLTEAHLAAARAYEALYSRRAAMPRKLAGATQSKMLRVLRKD